MPRHRRSLLIVTVVTCIIALRGLLPATANALPHAHDGCGMTLSVEASHQGCIDHPAMPAHKQAHGHDCGSCLPSPGCLSGLTLPQEIRHGRSTAAVGAAYALPRTAFLSGQLSPPDLRPPKAFLNL
ncbi:hypothetical protein [Asaia sp. VD9]|uniref:hypothetical protein n=1 Tax=Asaia sp. VD9 TaxID=3081235 RepID=UPI0030192D09